MSDLTNYAEGQFRDWMSQGTAPDAAPDPLYVALHTSAPGESPDGTTEVDLTSDYSRESVAAGTGWDTPNENDFENASEIAWAEATSDWGTISHVSLWDAADETGNCLAAFSLDSNKTISSGDQAKFNAGNLSFSID